MNNAQLGCLDKEYHARLIEMLYDVSRQAHIKTEYITTSAANWCTEAEMAWLQSFHMDTLSKSGLVVVNRRNSINAMSAMVGALIRNYIDARVIMTHELIDMEPREITAIAVPNFYLHSINAGSVAKWEAPMILEWLWARYSAGKKNILFVENLASMRTEYGTAISDFLHENYIILGGTPS